MDALYYLSGLFLILGLPILGFGLVAALIKPHLVNNRSVIKTPMSRGKIAKVGATTLVVSAISLSTLLVATEPAGVKAERAEQQAAEARALQVEQQQEVEEQEKAAEEEAKRPVIKTETKTEVVPFESIERNDSTIASGEKQVATSGVNGERTITYEVTYVQGKETGRKEIKNEITTAPVTQVTLNGTYVAPVAAPRSSCDPNYSGCVPNVSYDLDCADIGFSVQVLGHDKHRFDRDGDGYGCESY